MNHIPDHPGDSVPLKFPGLVLLLLIMGACRLFSPAQLQATQTAPPVMTLPSMSAVTATSVIPPTLTTLAALPTLAPPTQQPTQALSPQPTAAVPVRPTLPPAAPTHPDTLRLKIFLVAIGDNGQSGKAVGCGDSLIPLSMDVPYTQGVLRAALERLLSIKDQFYGESGLYNALYQSNLQIDGLKVENGEAVIQLSGQTMLGGECDTPRLIAQIEETALQFSTVQRVSVFLNGQPIRTALSLRGAD